MDLWGPIVGQTMPVSINLWVPTRGQSWDSCDHYKVVSNLQGLWQDLWGEDDVCLDWDCVWRWFWSIFYARWEHEGSKPVFHLQNTLLN